MPVATLGGRERPDDAVEGQALLHMRIFRDIKIVVIIHKIVTERLEIRQYRERD